jgi:hypothetical protein
MRAILVAHTRGLSMDYADELGFKQCAKSEFIRVARGQKSELEICENI